jgi:hypothetical protein
VGCRPNFGHFTPRRSCETPTSRKLKISQFYDNGTVGKYERARVTAAEPSNMWLAQTSQADVCASLTFHRPW